MSSATRQPRMCFVIALFVMAIRRGQICDGGRSKWRYLPAIFFSSIQEHSRQADKNLGWGARARFFTGKWALG